MLEAVGVIEHRLLACSYGLGMFGNGISIRLDVVSGLYGWVGGYGGVLEGLGGVFDSGWIVD